MTLSIALLLIAVLGPALLTEGLPPPGNDSEANPLAFFPLSCRQIFTVSVVRATPSGWRADAATGRTKRSVKLDLRVLKVLKGTLLGLTPGERLEATVDQFQAPGDRIGDPTSFWDGRELGADTEFILFVTSAPDRLSDAIAEPAAGGELTPGNPVVTDVEWVLLEADRAPARQAEDLTVFLTTRQPPRSFILAEYAAALLVETSRAEAPVLYALAGHADQLNLGEAARSSFLRNLWHRIPLSEPPRQDLLDAFALACVRLLVADGPNPRQGLTPLQDAIACHYLPWLLEEPQRPRWLGLISALEPAERTEIRNRLSDILRTGRLKEEARAPLTWLFRLIRTG